MFSMKGHNRPPFRPKIPGTGLRSSAVPMAIIYRPARSASQSGPRPRRWVLEFEPTVAPWIEPLMGWTANADPYRPIRLTFPDRDSAVAFAEQNDWRYVVREEQEAPRRRNPWAGASRHRLYKGADAPGAFRIGSDAGGVAAHRLHFGHEAGRAARDENAAEVVDPVIEASEESFPASDPPAWTGVTIASR